MPETPEPKLTRLEVVQVLLRTADKVIEEYSDDGKIDFDEITQIVGFAVTQFKEEASD